MVDSPVQLDMNTDYPEVKKEILDLLKNLSEKSKKEVCGYISSSGVFYEKENVVPISVGPIVDASVEPQYRTILEICRPA